MSDFQFHEPGSPKVEPLLMAIVLVHIETVQNRYPVEEI